MAYDNTNRGSIWKNDKKEKDTHPDFTGSFTGEDGAEYWVSAWKRKPDAKEKAPALTFSLKRKDQQAASAQPAPEGMNDFDDDIPF